LPSEWEKREGEERQEKEKEKGKEKEKRKRKKRKSVEEWRWVTQWSDFVTLPICGDQRPVVPTSSRKISHWERRCRIWRTNGKSHHPSDSQSKSFLS
jgi:hypothetical protein